MTCTITYIVSTCNTYCITLCVCCYCTCNCMVCCHNLISYQRPYSVCLASKYSQHLKVTTYSSAVTRCVCPNKAVHACLNVNRGHTQKLIRGKSAVRMWEAADRLPHFRMQLTHDLCPHHGQTVACVYLSTDLYCILLHVMTHELETSNGSQCDNKTVHTKYRCTRM